MEKNYKYCVYELMVESQIEIPQLDTLYIPNQPADIQIELGRIPDMVEEPIVSGSYSKLSKHEYICEVSEVAKFYVGYGRRIVIEPYKGVDSEIINLFLLGHMLGVLFGQRETVAIHSSSIVIDQNAVLICGYSGAGKSTTSAILTERGYKLLSDDISIIKVGKDRAVRTYRGFPQQKLCPDIVKQLKMNTDGMKHVTYQKEKYHAIALDHFAYMASPLKGIFEIRKTDSERLNVKEVRGSEKLASIIRNIFLRRIKYCMGGNKAYMDEIIKIAQNVPYFIIERPSIGFSGDQIADYIIEYAK